MFSAVVADWKFGSSCAMPTLLLESSWKRLRMAAIEAARDAAHPNSLQPEISHRLTDGLHLRKK